MARPYENKLLSYAIFELPFLASSSFARDRKTRLSENSAMNRKLPLTGYSLAVLLACMTAGPDVRAEEFPSRPVKIIVQAPGGSSLDVVG
jgi:hypothetical protein